MTNFKTYLKQFLIYFIPIFFTEILFRVLAQQTDTFIFSVRSLVFCIFLALLLWSLNQYFHNKITTTFTILLLILLPVYGFIQIGIRHYYGYFFSVRFLLKGMPEVGSYAADFIKYLKPEMFIFIAIAIISIIIYLKFNKPLKTKVHLRTKLVTWLIVVSIFISYLGLLAFTDSSNLFMKSISLYKNPYLTELATNQLGMSSLMFSDFQYLFFPDRADIEDELSEPENPNIPEPEPEEPNLLENRVFDNTEWIRIRDNETNESLKTLDSYFLNKPISIRNDATGRYKGKNFIYFLVEAFDMIAIHETLTPTLYKLKTQGTYMDHFYSPQFNCATAESELISLSSIYPVVGTCTMSAYYNKASYQTAFNLFKDAGYKTSSYHNWNDQFYPRSKIHPTLGSDKYLHLPHLIPKIIKGWQSDLTMMEGIVKDLNNGTEPFMAYVITSSTHLPYDIPSNLGQKYVKEVNKVYPDAPYEIKTYLSKAIELDKALEYLLENLEDMDNTVLALFSDHRPLKMPNNYLDKYSDIKRTKDHELDRTPMIIYSPNQTPEVITKNASTIDMLPTIANLFDIKHDPRFFMGTDLMSDETPLVIFHSGSWYDDIGFFNTNRSSFTPFNKEVTHTQEEINAINQEVKLKLSISSRLYKHDYFNQRKFLRDRQLISK